MKPAKIAYLLQVHRSPDQLNKFINQLLTIGNCDVYIHVSKSNSDMIEKITKNKHVKIFVEYDVKWGSYEIVGACAYLMKKVKESGITYDFVYFGSGQDLIIKENLPEFLSQNPSKLFIKIKKSISNNDRISSRYRVRWPKFLMVREDFHPYRFVRIFISLLCKMNINIFPNQYSLPKGWKVYEGHTWFTIPYEVSLHIVDFLDNNPEYIKFWKESLAADLMFFQTIIMNSPYKNNIEDELMYVEFGKSFKDMNHPSILQKKDINMLKASNKFFARKFDEELDNEVIDYYCDQIQASRK